MGQNSRTTSLLALAVVLALISGVTAIGAWVQNFGPSAAVETGPLTATSAPLLSARRVPNALQETVGAAELSSDFDTIVAQFPTSACVIAQSEGLDLFESLNPETPLLPASNLKLITTWAALDQLGSNHRYQTQVTGDLDPDGVVTNLTVVGGGDPFLATADWISQFSSINGRTFTEFEDLIEQLTDAGVSEIIGDITVDESRYDSQRVGPWAQRLIDQNQSGPLSALAVNEGFDSWGTELNLAGRTPSTLLFQRVDSLLINLLNRA